jgi:hypothetical protein
MNPTIHSSSLLGFLPYPDGTHRFPVPSHPAAGGDHPRKDAMFMKLFGMGLRLACIPLAAVLALPSPGWAGVLHGPKQVIDVTQGAIYGYYPTVWSPWPAPMEVPVVEPTRKMPPAIDLSAAKRSAVPTAAAPKKDAWASSPSAVRPAGAMEKKSSAAPVPAVYPLSEERPVANPSPYNPRSSAPR